MNQLGARGSVETTRRWGPYPYYKDSGVEWLGEIPEHWSIMPIKRIFYILNGSTPKSSEPSYWSGSIPWATPDDLGSLETDTLKITKRMITQEGYESCGTQLAPTGSLVLSTRAPIGHLAIAGVPLCTNQGCRCLVFRGKTQNRFYYHQLLAAKQELESWGQGSTFKELSRDKLVSVSLVSPTLDEQQAITAFLDRETSRIDTLIAKKQRQIELLQEKRTALISHAVTKGLNPEAKMKDSGIEWLGDIPSDWYLKRLKYVSPQITVGIVITPSKYYVESGIPCLRSLNVKEDQLTEDDLVYISSESNELLSKSKLHMGDLVAVRTGQPGTTAVINERYDGTNCIDLIIIRKFSPYDSRFLCYVMNSEYSKAQYLSGASGAIQSHFNIETASNMLIAVPPLGEQILIRERLDKEVGEILRLVDKIESSVNVLQEYRTALISAAVTGKIDVRKEVV